MRSNLIRGAPKAVQQAGKALAKQFIGFSLGEEMNFTYQSARKVDLSRFEVAAAFERGWEYAFRPSVLNTIREHQVEDLHVFMHGTPRAGYGR